ncbi:carboxypeptidase regulatory-like domain-containing protein [Saccharomonospora sp. NPDC046836]|uniref:carboxypeptidase regulatory-like domain-containing protein n=1 Tax=Saccharomonospora sp. NPDC046836 TaxID=3156921 RepID=UPI00340FF78A
MNEGGTFPDDEALLSELDRLVNELDPPPEGLVERAQFALALQDLDVEVARWERTDALAGVRGSAQGTITFTVSDLTVMINLTKIGKRYRIDGWLVPGAQYGVEVRVAGHESVSTVADDGGRFVLHDVPHGTTQIVVHIEADLWRRTVVTPAVVL